MNPTTVELVKLITILIGAMLGTLIFAFCYYIQTKGDDQ